MHPKRRLLQNDKITVVIYAASLNVTVAMEGLAVLDIIGGSRIA
jgi:hypothetical protein